MSEQVLLDTITERSIGAPPAGFAEMRQLTLTTSIHPMVVVAVVLMRCAVVSYCLRPILASGGPRVDPGARIHLDGKTVQPSASGCRHGRWRGNPRRSGRRRRPERR